VSVTTGTQKVAHSVSVSCCYTFCNILSRFSFFLITEGFSFISIPKIPKTGMAYVMFNKIKCNIILYTNGRLEHSLIHILNLAGPSFSYYSLYAIFPFLLSYFLQSYHHFLCQFLFSLLLLVPDFPSVNLRSLEHTMWRTLSYSI